MCADKRMRCSLHIKVARRVRLLFVDQDSSVEPFGWRSMVALLSLWEHTGMERLKMNETWE